MTMKHAVTLISIALFMSACAAPVMRDVGLDKFAPRKAEQALSSGIRAYENGDYKAAARSLQSALAANLLLTSDKVAAHKYLAFMHCAQSREKPCRDSFRRALDLDPKFELTPAEAGHPLWGPVFKSLR